MKTLIFKVQSYIDVITNSSTEIFCVKNDYTKQFDDILYNIIEKYNNFIEESCSSEYSTLSMCDFTRKEVITHENIQDTYFSDYDRIIEDDITFMNYFRNFTNKYTHRQNEINILKYKDIINITDSQIGELMMLYYYYKEKYNEYFKYYLNQNVCYSQYENCDKDKVFKDEKYNSDDICNFAFLLNHIIKEYKYQRRSDLIGSLYVTYNDCKILHPYFCELAETYLNGTFFSFH